MERHSLDDIRDTIAMMSRTERAELLMEMIDSGYVDDRYVLCRIDPSGKTDQRCSERAIMDADQEYPIEDNLEDITTCEVRKFVNEILREG